MLDCHFERVNASLESTCLLKLEFESYKTIDLNPQPKFLKDVALNELASFVQIVILISPFTSIRKRKIEAVTTTHINMQTLEFVSLKSIFFKHIKT